MIKKIACIVKKDELDELQNRDWKNATEDERIQALKIYLDMYFDMMGVPEQERRMKKVLTVVRKENAID